MKNPNILKKPLWVMLSFSFIVISGNQYGGFYLTYLVMGLSKASAIHSILGISGLALLFACMLYAGIRKPFWRAILNCVGILLMISSLMLFCINDHKHYNIATFYQIIPLTTVFLFAVLAFIFLIFNIKDLTTYNQDQKFKTLF